MTLTKIIVTPEGQQEVKLTADEITQYNANAAAFAAAQPNELIKDQIAALESTQTPRRVREGGQWMIDLNTQITALRAQLTS